MNSISLQTAQPKIQLNNKQNTIIQFGGNETDTDFSTHDSFRFKQKTGEIHLHDVKGIHTTTIQYFDGEKLVHKKERERNLKDLDIPLNWNSHSFRDKETVSSHHNARIDYSQVEEPDFLENLFKVLGFDKAKLSHHMNRYGVNIVYHRDGSSTLELRNFEYETQDTEEFIDDPQTIRNKVYDLQRLTNTYKLSGKISLSREVTQMMRNNTEHSDHLIQEIKTSVHEDNKESSNT